MGQVLWTIFERDSGRRLGEFRTHPRYTPFRGRHARDLPGTPPHARRQGQSIVEEPLQLSAADLSTGARVWSQPVRDTVDRQLPPP